jgi:hypothetical protein
LEKIFVAHGVVLRFVVAPNHNHNFLQLTRRAVKLQQNAVDVRDELKTRPRA